MYQNKTSGAFSQRQYRRAVRSYSSENVGTSVENADMCSVKVLYDNTMGDVMSETLVNGSITVKKGDTVKLIAQPKSGYLFVQWKRDFEDKNETSPTIDFVVDKDVVLEAVFAAEGAGGNPGGDDPKDTKTNQSAGLMQTVKKYWWVLAIILGYLILKEDKA